MSENDYEYQCMRAELLGLPKPDKPDPSQIVKPKSEDDDPVDVELELDIDSERFKQTSGGLDEINSILQTTQKKINKFKTVFGSVTSMLKGRASAEGSTENLTGSNYNTNEPSASDATLKSNNTGEPIPTDSDEQPPIRSSSELTPQNNPQIRNRTDIESMLSSHIQTLDSMVYKADDVNMKMNHQNKQMRNYLSK